MMCMQHVPTIAIVGRPNVGKSAIFNRMAGRRIAIVHDEPGVTRDRLSAPCKITDRACKIMDTGGIGARLSDGFAEQVEAEADIAIKTADLILFVLDCRDHLTPIDQSIADHLRKSDIPVILLLNKADHEKQDLNLGEFAGLGFDDHIFLSAAHGRGFSELASRLDGFLKQKGAPLKEELEEEPENGEETALPIKVAVVGRPNAGKSSLVNTILRDRRTIVSNVAGTPVLEFHHLPQETRAHQPRRNHIPGNLLVGKQIKQCVEQFSGNGFKQAALPLLLHPVHHIRPGRIHLTGKINQPLGRFLQITVNQEYALSPGFFAGHVHGQMMAEVAG